MYFQKLIILLLFCCLFSCKNQEENPPLDTSLEQAEQLFTNKEYRKAYYFYNQSLLYNQEQNNTKRAVYNLLRMAHIENLECDYIGSEATTTQAINYLTRVFRFPIKPMRIPQ